MASLILRPIASEGVVASTIPANTPIEDVYKLVNEEVADDNTTYFVPQANANSEIEKMLCLRFSLPKGIKIKSITELICKARYNSSVVTSAIPTVYSTKESLVLERDSWSIRSNVDNTYTDCTCRGIDLSDMPINFDSWIIPDYERMKSCFNDNDFCLLIYTTSTKTVGNLTQIYLELDCTYKEAGTPLYFKQNGEWAELSGNIYQKANGEWLEADVSVLNGEYPVEEV